MQIQIIQHQDSCKPGWILEWAEKNKVPVHVTRPDHGEKFPELKNNDLLLILGGAMNVDHEKEHPWLAEEKKYIKKALISQQPTLGICLGAQLMSEVLGARVGLHEEKEIGWHQLDLTAAGEQRWGSLKKNPVVFHFHECVFDLPTGATLLAKSAVTPNQAYAYGDNAVALQFHPEVTEAIVQIYVEDWDEKVGGAVQSRESILANCQYSQEQKSILFFELNEFKKKLL